MNAAGQYLFKNNILPEVRHFVGVLGGGVEEQVKDEAEAGNHGGKRTKAGACYRGQVRHSRELTMTPAIKMAQFHHVGIRIEVLIRRRRGMEVCTICKGGKKWVSSSVEIGTGTV